MVVVVVVGEGGEDDEVNGGGGPNDIFWYCFFLFVSCSCVYTRMCLYAYV